MIHPSNRKAERNSQQEPPLPPGEARILAQEMEEDLQRSRKARRRVVAIAHTVFGGMILIVTVVFVAFLQRNNWQILGVSPSFPKVALLSLVFLLGGLGLVIWLEWKSLSEEPPMENPDNRLQEIIRKEKWAMYEEDLERRRRGEEPKD